MQIIGYLMIFSVFAGMFITFTYLSGIKTALITFGSTVLISGWIIFAVYLTN